jgi:hypothetical protein
MSVIVREVDNLVRYIGPYKKTANTPIDIATESGAVVTLRLYLEDYEMRVISGSTRLREDIEIGATSMTIPHFNIPFIQTGDHLEWESETGDFIRRTFTTYTAGTSKATPATNFDTISWTDGAMIERCPKGTKIRLAAKAADNDKFAVSFKSRMLPGFYGLSAEVETGTQGVLATQAINAVSPVTYVEASEDGDPAENQEVFPILDAGVPISGVVVQLDARIRVKVGSDIPMAGYGTAVAGNQDWGWEGTIPDIIGGGSTLGRGETIRLTVTLSGVAGFADVHSILVPLVEP